ncbi:MAG TPA: hypothetical protein VJK04_01050 [Candidatus Paceibacterota bacterium]
MRQVFPSRLVLTEYSSNAKTRHLSQSVIRLFPADESKTLSAADITEEALKRLRDDCFIHGYKRLKDNGEIDGEGIDFLITVRQKSFALPLQVKGTKKSRRHLNRMVQKHRKIHPDVDFVIGIMLKKRNAAKWVYWKIRIEILRRIVEMVENYESDVEKTPSRLLVKNRIV